MTALAVVDREMRPIETYHVTRTGVSVRSVFRRSGDEVSTVMGRALPRRGESTADRAERAFLQLRARPAKGSGRVVRTVDMYAGCGGLSLGVQEACRAVDMQFRVAAAFDSDAAALSAYADNLGTDSALFSEAVRALFTGRLSARPTPAELSLARASGRVDFLVAGPPCQGWSSLNNHTRGADIRNALYRRVARAARIFEPKFIIIENVVGAHVDRAKAETINHLEGLGYHVEERVVTLSEIGVPQRRRRHVVVASTEGSPGLDNCLQAARSGPRPVRWAIGDLRAASGPGLDAPARQSPANRRRIQWLRAHRTYDLPNYLRPQCHRKKHSYVSMYGRLRWDAPAQTVTSGFGSMGQGRYVHPDGLRTLTPHEAARLQLFPDWCEFTGLTRTQLANVIGNAVPMKLSYVIALWLLR